MQCRDIEHLLAQGDFGYLVVIIADQVRQSQLLRANCVEREVAKGFDHFSIELRKQCGECAHPGSARLGMVLLGVDESQVGP